MEPLVCHAEAETFPTCGAEGSGETECFAADEADWRAPGIGDLLIAEVEDVDETANAPRFFAGAASVITSPRAAIVSE